MFLQVVRSILDNASLSVSILTALKLLALTDSARNFVTTPLNMYDPVMLVKFACFVLGELF